MAKNFPCGATAMVLFLAVVAASLGPSAVVAVSDEEPIVAAEAPQGPHLLVRRRRLTGVDGLHAGAGEDPVTNGCLKLLYWTHHCVMESNGKPLSADCCRDILPAEAQIRSCFHEIYDIDPEELQYFLKLVNGCHRGAGVPRRVMPGAAS